MGPTPKRSPLSADILSKYLVQYVPETPKPAKKPSASRVFGQRVLSSDQGYKLLADKETKEQEKLRENERKKTERVENKKRIELEKSEKQKKRRLRNQQRNLQVERVPHHNLHEPGSGSEAGPSRASGTTQESSNICCECSQTYEQDVAEGTGAEWVKCACGSWLHEECIHRIEGDENGEEKLCSSCIDTR